MLGVSLLPSATYAIINLIDRYTRSTALADQSTTLVPVIDERPWLDVLYQLRRYGFLIIPAFLALYLLSQNGRSATRRIGLTFTHPLRDGAHGLALAAAVGIPGLAFYLAGRALGLNVNVEPTSQGVAWWSLLILLIGALANAIIEEVVVVGYLAERLRDLTWAVPAIIAVSAILRGSYHLYQGPGMAIGNVAMGVLFAWYYLVWRGGRRVMPLVVAHFAIDAVAFVGYAVLPAAWLAAIGIG